MKKNRLGRTELYISAIGLGCRTLSVKERPEKIVERALDVGINFFDTADIYGMGKSEEILGDVLKGVRQDVVIATKGGITFDDGIPTQDLRPEAVRKAVKGSLKRLETDCIDLYQIHYPDPLTPPKETAKALKEFIDTGEVKYIGLSNVTSEELKEWLEAIEVASVQIPLNAIQTKMYDELIPVCKAKNVSIIAHTPLLMGLLVKIRPEYSRGDERHYVPKEVVEGCIELIELLGPLARDVGKTLSQLMLNWTLSHLGVSSVLVGASSPEQVEENAGAVGWKVPHKADQIIAGVLKKMSVSLDYWPITLEVKDVLENYEGRKVAVTDMGMKFKVSSDINAGDKIAVSWSGEYIGKVENGKTES